jgi:hypothetical protein
MPKQELLRALEDSRAELLATIDDLPHPAMLEDGVVGEWSVRDVLQHLSLWEAELVMLLAAYRQGRKPSSDRFRKSVDELNAEWHASTRHRPLESVVADFHAVRRQILQQLEEIPEDELSRPPRFAWLNGRPLQAWIADDSHLHEAEHTAHIRAWRKRRRSPEDV